MRPSSRRILILLDADGARRGFVTDGSPVSATIAGDGMPVAFGAGLDVSTLPVRAASLLGEAAGDAGTISAVLSLDAFDLFELRDRVPTQTVKVRAWLVPVNGDGVPVDTAGDEIDIMPAFEMFRGVVRSPRWDLRARTLTFTAAPDLRLLDSQFPPTTVDPERFPDAPSGDTSASPPVIYGSVWGAPLLPVSDPSGDPVRLLVAGHRLQSTATAIRRDDDAGNPVNVVPNAPILYDLDALGGVYAYVECPQVDFAAGATLYAKDILGWADPEGDLIDGLGDVLLHLWHTYGNERFYDLDRARCYSARDALNRYAVSLLFNQQEAGSGLIRMLQSRLEGQFPVAFGLVGGRMGWDCTRIPNAAEIPGLVVGTLTYGLDAHDRDGPTEPGADQVMTRFELHGFAQGNRGGPTSVVTADRTNMGALRGAVARWGESPLQRKDCPDIGLGDCAWSVLTDTAVAESEVRESVTYLGLDGEWNEVPLLGVLLVTDSECAYVEEPMLVTVVAPRLDGRVDMTLLRIAGL